jgi:hypothetical protein
MCLQFSNIIFCVQDACTRLGFLCHHCSFASGGLHITTCPNVKWAMSTGNHGVALMVLAKRLNDTSMAKHAVEQLNLALRLVRDGGHARWGAYYESQLPKARVLLDQLSKR